MSKTYLKGSIRYRNDLKLWEYTWYWYCPTDKAYHSALMHHPDLKYFLQQFPQAEVIKS